MEEQFKNHFFGVGEGTLGGGKDLDQFKKHQLLIIFTITNLFIDFFISES